MTTRLKELLALVALRGTAAAMRIRASIRAALRSTWHAIVANATELLLVVGWLLITAGVAHLTAPVAWLFSLGLLALAIGGLKVVIGIAWNGVEGLSEGAKRG